MQLELIRKYFTEGTNGEILYRDRWMVYSIELPWKNNQTRISCIPEGRYELVKRWSLRFNWHLQLMNVPQRSFILIHPANDASRELKGCIAPVCFITGAGKGIRSRMALRKQPSSPRALPYPRSSKTSQVTWLLPEPCGVSQITTTGD